MNVEEQIADYIATQPAQKQAGMQALHDLTMKIAPGCKLWFMNGKNEEGKVVSNPNIGYGSQIMKYADGKTKEWFRIGISANTTGISVYILGIEDKAFLKNTYGKTIGKASVTGYCIKFKKLSDINVDVLGAAIRHGLENQS